jgi:hypothetical protein
LLTHSSPELLDHIRPKQMIAADSAFDTRKCNRAIAARCAAATVRPGKNAEPTHRERLR